MWLDRLRDRVCMFCTVPLRDDEGPACNPCHIARNKRDDKGYEPQSSWSSQNWSQSGAFAESRRISLPYSWLRIDSGMAPDQSIGPPYPWPFVYRLNDASDAPAGDDLRVMPSHTGWSAFNLPQPWRAEWASRHGGGQGDHNLGYEPQPDRPQENEEASPSSSSSSCRRMTFAEIRTLVIRTAPPIQPQNDDDDDEPPPLI